MIHYIEKYFPTFQTVRWRVCFRRPAVGRTPLDTCPPPLPVPKFLFFILCFTFFSGHLRSAAAFSLVDNRGFGARAIAMGGAYTAVAADESTVFYNPAGYGTIVDPILTVMVSDISVSIDDRTIGLVRNILAGDDISDPDFISAHLTNVTFSIGMAGPIYFGRVGNNFGFAFYNNFDTLLKTTPGSLQPFAELKAYSDLGFNGGFGYEIANGVYAGFNLKVILRLKSQLEGSTIDVMDLILVVE